MKFYSESAIIIVNSTGDVDIFAEGKYQIKRVTPYWKDSKGNLWLNSDYKITDISEIDITNEYGNAKCIQIISEGNGVATYWTIDLYRDFVTFKYKIIGDEVSVSKICPLYSKEFETLYAKKNERILRVPFDNDKWVRYISHPLKNSEVSYGVTAVYDEESRNGIIIGALEYDTWKVGVDVKQSIDVYGGIADMETRDANRNYLCGSLPLGDDYEIEMPHGIVSGTEVSSPSVAVIPADDWRDGLVEFGKLCALYKPRLVWDREVPFGWNSWFAYMGKIDFDKYVGASDFVKSLKDFNHNGVAYINFDSFWTNLSIEELKEAVKRVRENGQIPGTYLAPFAIWSTSIDAVVEGYYGKKIEVPGFEGIKWSDVILKDKNGRPLPKLAHGYALDVTHPVVIERIKHLITLISDLGFKYVKLDFLSHAAMEGVRYNKNIQTGLQAYNYAMHIVEKMCNNAGMFISLSIAPIFPNYGHARRISCDIAGHFTDFEYMLNSLTYGFWQNQTIYEFTDPDHICLCEGGGQAKMRFISSVISGTIMLLSDRVEDEKVAFNTRKVLSKANILDIARRRITFRSVYSGEGDKSANVFIGRDSDKTYLALFNFENEQREIYVKLSDIGFDQCSAVDMWSNEEFTIDTKLTFDLNAKDCTILLLK